MKIAVVSITAILLSLIAVSVAYAGGVGVNRDYINSENTIYLHPGSSIQYGFRFPNVEYDYEVEITYELDSEIATVIRPEGKKSTDTLILPPRTANTELVISIDVPRKAKVDTEYGVSLKVSTAGDVGKQKKSRGVAIAMGTSATTSFGVKVVDPDGPEMTICKPGQAKTNCIDRNIEYATMNPNKPKSFPWKLIGVMVGVIIGTVVGLAVYYTKRGKPKGGIEKPENA